MTQPLQTIYTEDGEVVKAGDTVFNYYDGWWGVISDDIDAQGWFTLLGPGNKRAILNGERISTYDPKGSRP